MKGRPPGVDGNSFHLRLDKEHFIKGDMFKTGNSEIELEVVKVYERNWWRRLLTWFGFNMRIMQVKVKSKE